MTTVKQFSNKAHRVRFAALDLRHAPIVGAAPAVGRADARDIPLNNGEIRMTKAIRASDFVIRNSFVIGVTQSVSFAGVGPTLVGPEPLLSFGVPARLKSDLP